MNLTLACDSPGRIWCSPPLLCHKKQGRPRPPSLLQPVWSGLAATDCKLSLSALQQLAADKLPLIFKAGGGLDFELGADELADAPLGVGQQQVGQHGLVELEALAFAQPFLPQHLFDLGLQLVEQDADAVPQPVVLAQQGVAVENAGDTGIALGEHQQQLQYVVAAAHGVLLFGHDQVDP